MLNRVPVRLFLSYLLLIAVTLGAFVTALPVGGGHVPVRAWQIAAVLVVLAVVLAVVLSRRILASVTQVRDVAAQMAAGHLELRVPPMAGDELGQLGQTINTLADEIQRNMDGIIGEKNKMDAILSSLVDGVVTVSQDGTINFVNQMAGRILTDAVRLARKESEPARAPVAEETRAPVAEGTRADDNVDDKDRLPPLLGRNLADILTMAPVPELLEACRTSGAMSREMSLGERIFVAFAIPLGESGSNADVLFLLRDVTSLRQLETARSQFLGNVSHELKTPLTIIKGFVITLLKSPGILEEWKRYLDFIDRETDRLARLVDDVLNLARLRSKRAQMNFTFCESGELLRETYRQLQAQAAKYDSVLALDCPANLPVLLADPDRFKEIVINLVDNAFKYTPPKGRVELSAEATPEYLHVRVRDHGPGIPQEEIPFLFERFFRGTDKGGRKSGGTGIGLAIVKEIVDMHRGRITVDSVTGEGTTFDVALPLRQKGRRAEPEPLTTPSPYPGSVPSPPLRPLK